MTFLHGEGVQEGMRAKRAKPGGALPFERIEPPPPNAFESQCDSIIR
jgi:hypothetical protein